MKRGFHTGLLFLITAVFIFFPFSSGCSGGDAITGLPSAGGENTAVVSSIITGTVYDEGGQPLPNISVKLKAISNSVEMTAAADNKGSFTFTVSKSGNYYIEAETGDGKYYYSYEFSVKLGENQTVTVGYGPGPQGSTGPTGPPGLTGPAGATGATGTTARGILRVNVQDGGGIPIAYSRVKLERYGLTGSEEEIISSDSSGNGWYQFDNLYPGRYLLEVEAAGYVTYSQDITVGVGSQTTTSVLTSKVWQANVRVDDAPGSTDAWNPSVALDSSGNAYAVWRDNRNGDWDIYFSYRPSGGSWQANVRVDDASGSSDASSPSISLDSSGNAYVVWGDERNGNEDIYFSYRPSGGSWQANVRVDDASGSSDASSPSIALDSSGNAYAVWRDNRNGGGSLDIYFSHRPSGGSWQANMRVDDTSGSQTADYPRIALDSSENAYVIWRDNRNGAYDVYFSYRPSGGSWQTNIKVDDVPMGSGYPWYPSIAVDSSGNAYAVWDEDRATGTNDIYFSIME